MRRGRGGGGGENKEGGPGWLNFFFGGGLNGSTCFKYFFSRKHIRTVLSPQGLWPNLLTLWSDCLATEQSTGQSDHFHAAGGG